MSTPLSRLADAALVRALDRALARRDALAAAGIWAEVRRRLVKGQEAIEGEAARLGAANKGATT